MLTVFAQWFSLPALQSTHSPQESACAPTPTGSIELEQRSYDLEIGSASLTSVANLDVLDVASDLDGLSDDLVADTAC